MRRSDLLDLKHFPLFAGLGEHDREALASELSVQEVAAGETLFAVGDRTDGALFVVEGVLEICASDGEAARVGQGATLGALSLVADSRRELNAVAVDHVRLFALKRSRFERLMDAAPHTACRLLAALLRDDSELAHSAAAEFGPSNSDT